VIGLVAGGGEAGGQDSGPVYDEDGVEEAAAAA